jgi:hypothetical protein
MSEKISSFITVNDTNKDDSEILDLLKVKETLQHLLNDACNIKEPCSCLTDHKWHVQNDYHFYRPTISISTKRFF